MALWTSQRLDVKLELRDNEAMVCPAVGTTHGLGYQDIISVFTPDYYVVNQMPMTRSGVHPRGFLSSWKLKDCVGEEKLMLCTGAEE